MIKLSIITCTYNSEFFIQKALSSVIKQNLDPSSFEHIFVDGNSSDRTPEIINNYMNKNKFKTKFTSHPPKGVYNALNIGAQHAQGKYILFLNSDDYLEDNILEKYLNYIKDTLEKDLYYGMLNIVSNGKIVNTIPQKNISVRKLLFKFSFNILVYYPTVIQKKETFMELGMFDETKKIASDFGLWLKYSIKGKSMVFFPHIVSNFVEHDGSISSNKDNHLIQINEVSYFRKKYLGLLGVIIDKGLFIWGKIKNGG